MNGVPSSSGILQAGDGWSLPWVWRGRPDGLPVVVCHGGPGGRMQLDAEVLFDLSRYCVIFFDQRGCGEASGPALLHENTTAALVSDLEALRQHLGLEQWVVAGGSWGSTLALAYGEAFPDRVAALIIWSVFLGSDAEANWLFMPGGGASRLFPEAWSRFAPDGVLATESRLWSDRARAIVYARRWVEWERVVAGGGAAATAPLFDDDALALARLGYHYFANHYFLREDEILAGLRRLEGRFGWIVQGADDLVTRPAIASEVAAKWDSASFTLVPGGMHGTAHPAMRDAVRGASDICARTLGQRA